MGRNGPGGPQAPMLTLMEGTTGPLAEGDAVGLGEGDAEGDGEGAGEVDAEGPGVEGGALGGGATEGRGEGGQGCGGGRPRGGILGQGHATRRNQITVSRWGDPVERLRFLVDVRRRDGQGAVAAEGGPAGEHLVEHYPERVQVRSRGCP